MTSQNYLPELGFEANGPYVTPDGQVKNVEDMIINIEGHASSVSTDTECVLERALSDRD